MICWSSIRRIKVASEKKGYFGIQRRNGMVVDRNRTKEDFTIDEQQIEEVSQFEYLVSIINNIGDSTVKIKRTLGNSKVNNMEYAKQLEKSWVFYHPESTPSK